jgi:ABC-type dipeptide/oligopeptide/nickel transport system ATPase component
MSLFSARITVDYAGKPGVLHDFELEMGEGEILGLIGKSGSGKSTLALAILRLLQWKNGAVRGSIRFQGHELLALPERGMRRLRGRKIALVQQSPLTALNPYLTVGTQMREAICAHDAAACWKSRALELLEQVSLPAEEAFLKRYPRELSVGIAQRVLIAMAIAHHPALLIADEATSALDVITQAEILRLFRDLNMQMGVGILYISHDLLSVAGLCDRVAILHEGRIVETAPAEDIFERPQHPYTQALIGALPRLPAPGSVPLCLCG